MSGIVKNNSQWITVIHINLPEDSATGTKVFPADLTRMVSRTNQGTKEV